MSIELFNDQNHRCISYSDSCGDSKAGVQSNQFLIIDNGKAALLDPGGDLAYPELYMNINNEIMVSDLEYVLVSHQDPDVCSSLSKWVASTTCQVLAPKVWARFLPHLCRTNKVGKLINRITPIPDEGMSIPLGNTDIVAIPAHFLHSEGNVQFYDPVSKILFSGDLGASLSDDDNTPMMVEDFDRHIVLMEGFHRRYMSSRKIGALWANMIRKLDVEWIVPQHGASFKGVEMVNKFIDWVENQECGVDLMTQDHYRIPRFRQ
jgi:flavorubredoxin